MMTLTLDAPTETAPLPTALACSLPLVCRPGADREDIRDSIPAREVPSAEPCARPPTGQKVDDEALIDEICRGAEWAMELLHERYYKYAYTLAYHIVRDTTAVEDVLQEAFLAVWCKAGSYRKEQGSVRSWLQAIIHHRAIDRVRSAANRERYCVQLQLENESDRFDERLAVWEEVWQNECRALICRALEQLPIEQRRVIELSYFGGYTHVEIAERWHIPLGTVKGRMRLGLQKMRSLLRERGLERAW